MHTVSFLLLPGFSLLDVSGAIAVFNAANELPEATQSPNRYVVELLAAQPGPVASSAGILIAAEGLPADFERPRSSLIIAGGSATDIETLPDLPAQLLRGWLMHQQGHVDRGAIFGSAALRLLAEVEALSAKGGHGRGPGPAPTDKRSFPRALAGGRWVDGAVASGIDLALSWVEEDHGRLWADAAASRMPAPWMRIFGSERHRSGLAGTPVGDARIAELHVWISGHLRERLTVGRLATQTLMSARSFTRMYKEATGLTPAHAVERIRIDAACRLIETSVRPLKAIAAQCGFGSPEVMRRAFIRNLNVTPAMYRRDHQPSRLPNHQLDDGAWLPRKTPR